MPVYTASEIAGFASNAGVPNDKVATMVAIAFAESSGNSDSRGVNDNGTVDVGLWQINSVHRTKNPMWTESWLRNPVNNARAMAALSNKGSNLQPWDASKSVWQGTGKKSRWQKFKEYGLDDLGSDFVGGAEKYISFGWGQEDVPGIDASDIPIIGPAADAVSTVGDATIAAANYAEKVASWVGNPRNWLRVAYVGLGTGVVIVGLAKLMGVNDVAGKALSVVPGGSLAKSAGTKVGTAQANSASTQYAKAKSAATNPPKPKPAAKGVN